MAAPGIANWQSQLLQMLGDPTSAQNIAFLNAWNRAEGGGAANNPFNTTQPGFGAAGNYNSVGVKNYSNPMQGLQATAATLKNGRYGNILAALHSGTSAMQSAHALANSPWGTGSLVEKVLGGSGGSQTAPTVQGSQQATGNLPLAPGGAGGSQAMALMLMQAAANGGQLNPGDLLGMAMQRRSLQAASQTYGATPSPATPVTPAGKTLPFIGNYGNEDPQFVHNLMAAASAAGATKIRVNSGERSMQHNKAVGGASDSNHLPDSQGYGHALDGEAFVPGKGWVPLGTLLMPIANKYHLRSGATFDWNGHPDVVHVDDGHNQG